jgi:hypothetical protein
MQNTKGPRQYVCLDTHTKEQFGFFRVNNIITPEIIYGSAVFGMSEKRTMSLKK